MESIPLAHKRHTHVGSLMNGDKTTQDLVNRKILGHSRNEHLKKTKKQKKKQTIYPPLTPLSLSYPLRLKIKSNLSP